MNLSDLRAFVAVAEAGSIQKAADRLNLTQPAVTRQIQRLESQFEVVLLNRRTKPLALTPSGKVALAHCRRVLDAVKDLSGSLANDSEPAGDFRLGFRTVRRSSRWPSRSTRCGPASPSSACGSPATGAGP